MATTSPERAQHTTAPPAQPTTASPIDQHTPPTTDTPTRSGKATASFVVGIIALIAAFAIPGLGLLLGIVATVLGNVGRKEARATRKSNVWMGSAGFWLGIASIAVSVIVMVIAGIMMF